MGEWHLLSKLCVTGVSGFRPNREFTGKVNNQNGRLPLPPLPIKALDHNVVNLLKETEVVEQ